MVLYLSTKKVTKAATQEQWQLTILFGIVYETPLTNDSRKFNSYLTPGFKFDNLWCLGEAYVLLL